MTKLQLSKSQIMAVTGPTKKEHDLLVNSFVWSRNIFHVLIL